MRRTVTINLDKPRELRFNTNATVALEEALGRSVNSLLGEQSDVGFRELRAIIWAGLQYLKKEGKAPSLDDVGDMIDDMIDNGQNLQEIGKDIGTALAGGYSGNSQAAGEVKP